MPAFEPAHARGVPARATGIQFHNNKQAKAAMKRILTCLVVFLALPAVADMHAGVAADVREVVKSLNAAYADNAVEKYFDYYAADASVYFYGARQDVAAYREEWAALVDAGGGVEKNELADIQVRVMPSGDVAVASYFIDYRLRGADGEIVTDKAFETDVWLKIDGEWKLVNLHYSELPEQP